MVALFAFVTYFFILESSLFELINVVGGFNIVVFFSFADDTDIVDVIWSLLASLPLPVPPPEFSDFKSLSADAGTFGVFTGSIGELVLDRLPKNLNGFSGPLVFCVASNFARPLATAPEII